MSNTYPINTTHTIAVTSTVISPDRDGLNNKRKSIILTNTSLLGEIIYISIGAEAVYGSGFPLYPGGSWDKDTLDDPPQFQINAIASVATATLSHYEELK